MASSKSIAPMNGFTNQPRTGGFACSRRSATCSVRRPFCIAITAAKPSQMGGSEPLAKIKRGVQPHVETSQVLHLVAAGTTMFSATAALLLALGPMAMPPAASAEDLGKTVFDQNCAVCHMGGKNSVIVDHTLDAAALTKYLAGGFKLESIIYQVNNGKGAMPAWENSLEEEEVAAVSQYVFDTATAGTWDSQ